MPLNTSEEAYAVFNDCNPEQATQIKQELTPQYESQIQNTIAAQAEAELRKSVCDETDEAARDYAALSSQKTAELSELEASLRAELYSLRGDFSLEDQSNRLRKLRDAVAYIDTELDRLLRVTRGANEILYLDALENLASCRRSELHTAAILSHVTTVAALGPAYDGEGGLGVIGHRTLKLQQEAILAGKQYESAKNAAREARLAYDRSMVAWASRGLVTSSSIKR